MNTEDLKRVDELIEKADACNKNADELDDYEDILPARREGNNHALLAIAMMLRDQIANKASLNRGEHFDSYDVDNASYGSKP